MRHLPIYTHQYITAWSIGVKRGRFRCDNWFRIGRSNHRLQSAPHKFAAGSRPLHGWRRCGGVWMGCRWMKFVFSDTLWLGHSFWTVYTAIWSPVDIFIVLWLLKVLLLLLLWDLSHIRSPRLPSVSTIILIPHGRSSTVSASAAVGVAGFINVSCRMWSLEMHLLLWVHLNRRIRLWLLHVCWIGRRLMRYDSWWWRRWWGVIGLRDDAR